MNKAIFLDRDGVINYDHGYVYKISDFRLIEGVVDALKFFQLKKYLLIIVTNQSGIGRGYFTEQEFQEINSHMLSILKNDSININGVYYCPHHPNDNCKCRKPKNYYVFSDRSSNAPVVLLVMIRSAPSLANFKATE